MTAPSAAWLAQVTRLDPPRGIEAPPSWDEAVRVLAEHGLSAIAAYNLQFRMPDARVPESARDVLQGYSQGMAGDNVYKLVTLKTLLSGVVGPKVVMLSGAAFAEQLYPHIAFRPVPELRLFVEERDLSEIEKALGEGRFVAVDPEEPDPDAPRLLLSDGRISARLYTHLLPNAAAEPGIFLRALRAPALGASVHRPSAEDALLLQALSLARRSFAVPLIDIVDVREMVRGASATAARGGPGSPLDAAVVKARAAEFGAERALYATLEVVRHFHPEVEGLAEGLRPDIGLAARKLIDTAVVAPARDYTRSRQLKGTEVVSRLLFG